MKVLEVLLIFIFPSLLLIIKKRTKFFNKISTILLCYLLGFVFSFFIDSKYKVVSQSVASVVVMIAIPLILFSFNILDARKLAKTTALGFILLVVSTMSVSSIVGIIAYKKGMNYALQLAGMSTGLYVGGTPNMFAIGEALVNDINIVNIANISDSLIGGIYIVIVMFFGKKIYGLLPKKESKLVNKENIEAQNDYDFSFIKNKKKTLKLLLCILLAFACVGFGVLIEYLINGNLEGSLYIILTVSILGIVLSFIPSIRSIEGSYQMGQYLVLVFSFALSLSINFEALNSSMLSIFIFFACVQVLTIVLHYLLCAVFKIDGGTALITSIAGIYGPPFIAPVAKAYGDDNLIAPGIICGVIGLTIGNLLGIGLSSFLISLY